jgi:hypothetical protein
VYHGSVDCEVERLRPSAAASLGLGAGLSGPGPLVGIAVQVGRAAVRTRLGSVSCLSEARKEQMGSGRRPLLHVTASAPCPPRQTFYVRPRYGDCVWDPSRAAKLKWLLEAAIMRRQPQVREAGPRRAGPGPTLSRGGVGRVTAV